MAYGQFTSYEAAPDVAPDAFRFSTADGKKILAAGDPALQLKSRLDAYDAGTRTAGLPGAPAGLTPEDPGPGVNPFTGKPYQGAPAAPAAPDAPAQQGPGGQLGYGLSVNQAGQIVERKFVPGTKAVTKEDIQQAEADKTAVKQGQTEVAQSGVPQDQAYLDARAEATLEKRLQLQRQMEQEKAALEDESALAQQQFESAQRLQSEEAARRADLTTKYEREEALKNKAFEEYTSSKVEPGRIFANPGRRILSALAAAGGAFAATVAKTPNFAQQIIDQAIERDIRAQEAEIKLKGEKANNLLANMQRTGMTRDQAWAAAKSIQTMAEQRQLQALRAKNAVPAAEAHYANLDQALQDNLRELNEQSRLASIEKVTRSVQSGFASPRAGTAGGVVEVAVKDQLGTAKRIQDLKKGEQDLANPKGIPASPEKRKAMGIMAEAARLQTAIKDIPDDTSAVPPLKRGPIDRTIARIGEWGGGEGGGTRLLLNEQEQRELADLLAAKEQIKSLRSVLSGQGALDEQGSKRAEAALAPGATAGEVKRTLADLYSSAAAANIAADATGEAGGVVVTK